jgi:hypothetical protein
MGENSFFAAMAMSNQSDDASMPLSDLGFRFPVEPRWCWNWRYHPSLYDHMHALGVVATNYNHLEFIFFLLFRQYMTGGSAPILTFSHLNNFNRADVFRAVDDQESDSVTRDRLDHFVSGFKICTDNRNFLMHLLTQNAGTGDDVRKRHLELAKRARTQPTRHDLVRLSLRDIRRIANEMDTFDEYGFSLVVWLMARKNDGILKFDDAPDQTPELSDKPDMPGKGPLN